MLVSIQRMKAFIYIYSKHYTRMNKFKTIIEVCKIGDL